jgi:pyruvate/2-oxoglutarate/acetoin dehydrogenase E1 component
MGKGAVVLEVQCGQFFIEKIATNIAGPISAGINHLGILCRCSFGVSVRHSPTHADKTKVMYTKLTGITISPSNSPAAAPAESDATIGNAKTAPSV